MRALCILALVALAGCSSPAAALLPMAARSVTPEEQEIAVPTEDGSHYILVEARPRTTDVGLARKWRRTATEACKGDYILLSAGAATRRTQGVSAMRIQEGWVRCISPEAIEKPSIKRGTEPKKAPEPKKPPQKEVPRAFAL